MARLWFRPVGIGTVSARSFCSFAVSHLPGIALATRARRAGTTACATTRRHARARAGGVAHCSRSTRTLGRNRLRSGTSPGPLRPVEEAGAQLSFARSAVGREALGQQSGGRLGLLSRCRVGRPRRWQEDPLRQLVGPGWREKSSSGRPQVVAKELARAATEVDEPPGPSAPA